jgi:hypothetical protein
MREQGTALAEDLASHGYIVVTFGSTYEAFGVEFPAESNWNVNGIRGPSSWIACQCCSPGAKS